MVRRVLTIFMLAALVLVGGRGTVHAQATETHTVQSNETLFSIAQRYNTTVARLRKLNDLQGTTIQVGQTLRVPAQGEVEHGVHKIQPGETLIEVAFRYGVAPDSLLKVNPKIKPSVPLNPGTQITLPSQFQMLRYTVQAGNTLAGISRKYGVSVDRIRQANDLTGTQIQVGQTIRIPTQRIPEPLPRGELGTADTTGRVNVYAQTYKGRLTASGEPYHPEDFTASHPTAPFGTILLLRNPSNDRYSFVRVNDRGPVDPTVMVDVSTAAARQLRVMTTSNQLIDLYSVW